LNRLRDYENLTPELVIQAVEDAIGKRMTGLISPLPSYINRVYELQAMDETRLIAKFYRPGRWTLEMIQEEHDFIQDCADDEIPAIAPLQVGNGKTLHQAGDYYFTVFPKKQGRLFEINNDEDWIRIGALIGRIHVAGSRQDASTRIRLDPALSTKADLKELLESGLISRNYESTFNQLGQEILDSIIEPFQNTEFIRIHGDCHRANILDRMDEGLIIIDFDDMVVGPPVQDLWLLLPDRVEHCRKETNLFLEGYEQFKEFDDSTLSLVEPLRIMRNIYYLAWCGRQVEDLQFRKHFPDWGCDEFWRKEVCDLQQQLEVIRKQPSLSGNC